MFVISIDTGEVLDYHVLFESCQLCALKKGKCTDEEFEKWLLEHECDINFTGSSPAMEAEGAVFLWGVSGWLVMGTAKLSIQLNTFMMTYCNCGKIGLCRACSEKNGKALAEPQKLEPRVNWLMVNQLEVVGD